jgi:hypothetical protein
MWVLRWVGLRERFEERVLPQLVKVGSEALRTNADLLQLSLTDPRDHNRLVYVRKCIRSALKGGKPIIAGPWISEIGFEVLYWIPFLRWFAGHYRIPPEQIIAVSRGGPQAWYHGLADRYADVFDILTPEEFRRRNEMRIRELGHQKQSRQTEFEKSLCDQAARNLGVAAYSLLHPSVMFRLFARYWKGYAGFEFIDTFARYRSMRSALDARPSPVRQLLPERYAAVKFYFRESLPDTLENRAAISRIIRRLSRHIDVVLLDTGLCIDDHVDCGLEKGADRIHTIDSWFKPNNNLAVQTEVIAGAQRFFGTYGGMTYVASLLGVPAVCFESVAEFNLSVHTELAMRKLRPLGASFHLLNVNDTDIFDWLSGAETARHDEPATCAPAAGEPSRRPRPAVLPSIENAGRPGDRGVVEDA